MSAAPARFPEPLQATEPQDGALQSHWAGVDDQALVQQLLGAGSAGTVLLVAEQDQLHPAVRSLFGPALTPLAALIYGDRGSGSAALPAVRGPGSAGGTCPVLVLDTVSLTTRDVDYILSILPASVPVVLLQAAAQPLSPQRQGNIVATLANDAQAADNWAQFQSLRECNSDTLVVLDYIDSDKSCAMEQYLSVHNFQTVTARERAATTFVQTTAGSQLLLIESGDDIERLCSYLRCLRQSHDPELLGIVVCGTLQDAAQRCTLLEAGADELLDDTLSNDETLIRLSALCRRQQRARQIRRDAYRFPGSDAYNLDYLMSVGGTLYASAQRDVISMALAVIRVELVETNPQAALSRQQADELLRNIACYCGRHLRETDLFAQTGERDFLALVTCVGRNNISRVFNRLSLEVGELVDRVTEGRVRAHLDTGATCELGMSFQSMIERARMALLAAQQNPQQQVVVR